MAKKKAQEIELMHFLQGLGTAGVTYWFSRVDRRLVQEMFKSKLFAGNSDQYAAIKDCLNR